MNEAEMRRRILKRASANLDRYFVKRTIETALARLPKETADALLCTLIVERCPEMFDDLDAVPAPDSNLDAGGSDAEPP